MKRSVICFMAASLVMLGALVGKAQQKATTADFSFTMQNASGTMSLACEHGCAWKTLRWSGQSGTDVFINDRGMVGGDNKEENSTFLIGIHAGHDKMELSCKHGCAWEALSYSSLYPRDAGLTQAVSGAWASSATFMRGWGRCCRKIAFSLLTPHDTLRAGDAA